jgi:hypothetical protein
VWNKSILLAAVLWLVLANSSSAEQYALTNWNGKELTLVDIDSVKPIGARNRFWAISYNAPLEAKSRGFEYFRALYEIDCREMKLYRLQVTFYDNDSNVLNIDRGGGEGMFVVPGSVGQFMVSPICTPAISKHYPIGEGGWSDPLGFAQELISSMPDPNSYGGDR